MAAVRVPPSACSTSQSSVMVRSPSAERSTQARSERPIRRWISSVRPPCLPREASRSLRVLVARGSMPYSAVTQPSPLPRRKPGTRFSTLAVHSTRVSPKATSTDPSAWRVKPRVIDTARIWSAARPLGRERDMRGAGKKRGARLPFASRGPGLRMIRSMTAFASGERATEWGVLACEVRAVNHRFLELGLRLPEELRGCEPLLRERVAARISRGKLDLAMRLRSADAQGGLHVNDALVGELAALNGSLGAQFPGLRTSLV